MRNTKTILTPIIIILSGVLLQLKAMGIIGNGIADDLIGKIWPIILAAAALDMILTQRRLIGGLVLGFFAAALLSTQFMDAGWNSDLWQLFMKCWPILLILYGVDCIFAGQNILNAAVIIAAVILIAYAVLMSLDVPLLQNVKIDLPSLIPTSSFEGVMPQQDAPRQQPTEMPSGGSYQSFPIPQPESGPEITVRGTNVNAPMPSEAEARLELNAASGKLALKAGGSGYLSGTVRLDGSEKLSSNASQQGNAAVYALRSTGSGAVSSQSEWDLSLASGKPTALTMIMNSGYLKADLRSLNLTGVSLENKYGPVDVMVPQSADAVIKINVSNGNLRLYVPSGASVSVALSGEAQLDYPMAKYDFDGSRVTPKNPGARPVSVEVYIAAGSVQIIDNG